ncbi:MAG: M14 family metallopeptidase [Candidatus Eremiobacteraeota bacterium]|nr:M14 family metallopeptidase [Candidatus Eremiobacteraeota bacterium]
MKTFTLLILFITLCAGLPAANAGAPAATPVERHAFQRFTPYDEMLPFIKELDGASPQFTVRIIGKSVKGRDIPALFLSSGAFASDRERKPVVMILCQQHGDEPSGKEAALMIASELATGPQALLEKVDIAIIPMVNPDGAEKESRTNANDRDLNRNHVILTEPEVQALHSIFWELMPEVTLDVHEYGPGSQQWVKRRMVKNADEMFDMVSNVNISPRIFAFSQSVMLPAVERGVRREGFTYARYVVGTPFDGGRIRHSTTDICDGRQSFGIYNTLSYILEGRNCGKRPGDIEKRVKGQRAAIMALLETSARQAPRIVSLVREERASLKSPDFLKGRAFIQMDYFPDPLRRTFTMPILDLATMAPEERAFRHYEPLVKIKKSMARPWAYVIPAGETGAIEIMKRHHIDLVSVESDMPVMAERTMILHLAARKEEETVLPNVDCETLSREEVLHRGDIVVRLEQSAGLLIPLMLEPESSWGLVTDTGEVPSAFAGTWLREGYPYPVIKIKNPGDLPGFDKN